MLVGHERALRSEEVSLRRESRRTSEVLQVRMTEKCNPNVSVKP